jgi:hypothetical protein
VLPRLGLKLALPAGLENVTYYGRGPVENYRDRNEGTPLGRYETTVDDMYVPYIWPQEFGNRTEVRWAALTDDQGAGLVAVAGGPLEFSAHHYTLDNLDRAEHTCELERTDQTWLYLDYAQTGVGTRSCGHNTLEPYRVRPGRYVLRVLLRPLAAGQDPADLARERIPEQA